MVQLVLIQTSTLIAQGIRFILRQCMLVQRASIYFGRVAIILIGKVLYQLFKWHKPMVIGLQWLFRVGFFLRGIHIKFDYKNQQPPQHSGLHLCNYGSYVYWILFSVLPYKHLIIAYDEFFSFKLVQQVLFLLGFIQLSMM